MKLLSRRGGINRATIILLILIGIMLIIIAIPSWKVFRYRSEKTACVQAMKSAADGLIIDYLGNLKDRSVEEAQLVLDEVMPARDELCPAHGTIYLIKNSQGIYEPFCGIHADDKKLRCRLNASRAKTLLEGELEKAEKEKKYGAEEKTSSKKDEPVSTGVYLNGQTLECVLVSEEEDLHRGTGLTAGYDGIVAFYGLDGEGSFSSNKTADGEICYFIYADESYAAIWRADKGWTGTAYD